MARKTRKERAAEAQRLMAALSDEGAPLTITETGETLDHAPDDMIGAVSDDIYTGAMVAYGGCQTCSLDGHFRNDARFSIGREVWSVCETHHTRWFSCFEPPNISSETWAAHEARLQDYKRTTAYRWPEIPEDEPTSDESYDRLWMILRNTHTDRALLIWILETHHDLPPDLAWLIQRQLSESNA